MLSIYAQVNISPTNGENFVSLTWFIPGSQDNVTYDHSVVQRVLVDSN